MQGESSHGRASPFSIPPRLKSAGNNPLLGNSCARAVLLIRVTAGLGPPRPSAPKAHDRPIAAGENAGSTGSQILRVQEPYFLRRLLDVVAYVELPHLRMSRLSRFAVHAIEA